MCLFWCHSSLTAPRTVSLFYRFSIFSQPPSVSFQAVSSFSTVFICSKSAHETTSKDRNDDLSLFTNTSFKSNIFLSTAMCEMMKIMQENREVTCCLGSSANFRNSRLFLQSDVRYARYDSRTFTCGRDSEMGY